MTKLFSPKWWISSVTGIIIIAALLMNCNPAAGQERAVIVSSEKIKHSTEFLVCVELKSGKRYSFKYNSHCWRCDSVYMPTYWTVIEKRKKVFIKPEL